MEWSACHERGRPHDPGRQATDGRADVELLGPGAVAEAHRPSACHAVRNRLSLTLATMTLSPRRFLPRPATDDRRVVVRLVKKIVDDGDDRQIARLRALIEIFMS